MLVELVDSDFDAMLRGDETIREAVAAPPGGVDEASVVAHVRSIAAWQWENGYRGRQWMIVAAGEAVGMIGIKQPPSSEGDVEIGYSIAASRRRRGHATRAVGLVVDVAQRDPSIRSVCADTAVANIASQRVLERNGFESVGTRFDPVGGEMIVWRKRL
jgi:RimJ/RimL family protein N-acetyltransferase